MSLSKPKLPTTPNLPKTKNLKSLFFSKSLHELIDKNRKMKTKKQTFLRTGFKHFFEILSQFNAFKERGSQEFFSELVGFRTTITDPDHEIWLYFYKKTFLSLLLAMIWIYSKSDLRDELIDCCKKGRGSPLESLLPICKIVLENSNKHSKWIASIEKRRQALENQDPSEADRYGIETTIKKYNEQYKAMASGIMSGLEKLDEWLANYEMKLENQIILKYPDLRKKNDKKNYLLWILLQEQNIPEDIFKNIRDHSWEELKNNLNINSNPNNLKHTQKASSQENSRQSTQTPSKTSEQFSQEYNIHQDNIDFNSEFIIETFDENESTEMPSEKNLMSKNEFLLREWENIISKNDQINNNVQCSHDQVNLQKNNT